MAQGKVGGMVRPKVQEKDRRMVQGKEQAKVLALGHLTQEKALAAQMVQPKVREKVRQMGSGKVPQKARGMVQGKALRKGTSSPLRCKSSRNYLRQGFLLQT